MVDMAWRVIQGHAVRGYLVAVALGLDLLTLHSQIDSAIASAACLERAKYEMVLCATAPWGWEVALTGALAVGLSIILGAELVWARRGA